MKFMNKNPIRFQYKCLPFLIMLEVTFYICHALFMNKLAITTFGILSTGSLIVPFWGMLDDIITEVYGLKMAIRIYWVTIYYLVILSEIIPYILNLPSPSTWHESKTYTYIFNHFNFFIPYAIIIGMVSFWINTYLLIKWKILLNGKYFWLRSVGSSFISDLVFLILLIPTWIIFGPASNIKEAIHLTIISYTIRLIFYLILAFPANFVVNLLKIIEQIDIHESLISFNPFKKQPNMEEVRTI